jgi:hypothetical protein
MARAKSIGEICDVLEEFNKAAMYLKMNLATDETLPKPIRDALDGPVEIPQGVRTVHPHRLRVAFKVNRRDLSTLGAGPGTGWIEIKD